MSKAKSFALYGSILASVSVVWSLIFSFVIHSTNFSALKEVSASGAVAVEIGVVVGIILSLVELAFYWLAFVKMDGPHGRGWSIFLLVMGILSAFGIFNILLNPVGAILAVGMAVFFILTFVNRPKKEDEEEF